jgi:hypothetical protein
MIEFVMKFEFSKGQLKLLSNLFIDIAKAGFIAAFTIPAISNVEELAFTTRSILLGLTFTLLSLKMELEKEKLL